MDSVMDNICVDELPEPYNDMARIIGTENLMKLVEEFGGTQIYLPRKNQLMKEYIYKAILKEFNGSNRRELSKKYDISESTIYRIIKQASKV